jgi:hypothetical protein
MTSCNARQGMYRGRVVTSSNVRCLDILTVRGETIVADNSGTDAGASLPEVFNES